MREIHLNLKELVTKEDVQDTFAACFDVPDYYGYNLDAMYDVLTDVDSDTELTLDFDGLAESELPYEAWRALRVMRDAARSNERIMLKEVRKKNEDIDT